MKYNELHSQTEWPQVLINRLKVCKCALQENLLSSSHGARVLQIHTEAFMIRFTELQQKFRFQPQRMLAVKVGPQPVKNGILQPGVGKYGRTLSKLRTFNTQSQGIFSPEEVASLPSGTPLEMLPFFFFGFD